MENENAKRAQRRRESWRVAGRRFKLHTADHRSQGASNMSCWCKGQAGRFRKRGLGCSNARCLVCHYGKIFGIRRSEKLANIRTQEAMRDLRDDPRYS